MPLAASRSPRARSRKRLFSMESAMPYRLAVMMILALPALARADAFDHYINPILVKAAKSKAVKRIDKLTSADMIEHSRDVTGLTATFVIVKTNDGRMA